MPSISPRVGLSIKRLQMRHHRAVNAELAGTSDFIGKTPVLLSE